MPFGDFSVNRSCAARATPTTTVRAETIPICVMCRSVIQYLAFCLSASSSRYRRKALAKGTACPPSYTSRQRILFAYPPEGLRKYLDWVIRHRHDRPADADRPLDE